MYIKLLDQNRASNCKGIYESVYEAPIYESVISFGLPQYGIA